MDRNIRTLKIKTTTKTSDSIKFYDYCITNACIIKFINSDFTTIKDFFGTGIIIGLDELDSLGDVIKTESFYFKRKQINVANETIIEEEKKLVKDAYDEKVVDELGEPVIDEATQQQLVIHHEAEYEIIKHEIPVEMTTVYLQTPEISDEINFIKEDVNKVKTSIEDVKTTVQNMEESKIDSTQFEATLFMAKEMAQDLSDEKAVCVKALYPTFDTLVKEKFTAKTKGYKFTHENVLYKTIKDNYKFKSHYIPGQGTESLFTRIDETHAGTQEDPIPYHVNMEVFNDKFYIEDGILYKCTRDSGIALHNKASELVGDYFEKVNK